MPIYHVKRTDEVGWDETAAVVVVASDEHEARELAKQDDEHNYSGSFTPASWDKATVTEVDPDSEPRVVLSDFNAG